MTRSSGRGVLSATEYAGIYAHENAVATTLAGQDTDYFRAELYEVHHKDRLRGQSDVDDEYRAALKRYATARDNLINAHDATIDKG